MKNAFCKQAATKDQDTPQEDSEDPTGHWMDTRQVQGESEEY